LPIPVVQNSKLVFSFPGHWCVATLTTYLCCIGNTRERVYAPAGILVRRLD